MVAVEILDAAGEIPVKTLYTPELPHVPWICLINSH